MDKIETYMVQVRCDNCSDSSIGPLNIGVRPKNVRGIDIPKGVFVDEFLKSVKCEHCGCTGFMRKLE